MRIAGKEHDGSYGSGRFCSEHCRRIYCGKKVKHHVCNFNKNIELKRASYGTWKCRFCDLIFESKGKLWKHYHECHQESLCKQYGQGKPAWNKGLTKESSDILKKSSVTLRERYSSGKIVPFWLGKKHTLETKKKLSELQKKYLADNLDSHPWKSSDKFKSVPCERLKTEFTKRGLKYTEEFTDPSWEHSYAIDIAFPDFKIGIEVNGNQHYSEGDKLLPYYQEREEYLKKFGWTLVNVHYYSVYDEKFVDDLVSKLLSKGIEVQNSI